MAARTHELFAALANPQRLAIVTHLVEEGEPKRTGDLLELDDLEEFTQPAVSSYLGTLAGQGLVIKSAGRRGSYAIPMSRTTATLIESAAAIHEEYFNAGAVPAAELRRRMRKADMARLKRRPSSAA